MNFAGATLPPEPDALEEWTPDAQGSAARRNGAWRPIGVVLVSLCIFLLSAYLNVGNDYAGVAALTLVLLIGFADATRSSLGAVILFSGISLFSVPYLALVSVDAGVQVAWFAAFLIVAQAMITFGDPVRPLQAMPPSRLNFPIIVVALIAGMALWSDNGIFQVSFYAGWAVAMLHLDRLHASTDSTVWRLAGVGAFVVLIGLYLVFLWGGYGRIIFLSFALAPILLTVHYKTIRLNPLLFVTAVGALPFIGRVLRFGWSDGLAGLTEDSGASPITLTSALWSTTAQVVNPGSIGEQWVLLFLGWVPREYWPTKPIGINSSFVDLFLGRQGLSLEHSTAIGFFGEHLFYLPQFWWVSAGLLTAVMIALRRLIARVAAPYVSPVIVFDVWLITLFWGGMASFAARAWFAIVPMMAYLFVLKRRGVVQPPLQAAGAT